MEFRIRKVDSQIEKRILMAMIVSKDFLQEIMPLINPNYFANSYARRVASWVIEFWGAYETNPFDNIQDIYLSKKEKLKEPEQALIETLLMDISEQYGKDDKINVDYMVDKTIDYFKRRELELISANIKDSLTRDNLVDAEKAVIQFKKVGKLTSTWIDPFSEESVEKVFRDEDSSFFKFPGELGEFLGPYERGWLVGIAGPYKRGKSWLLQEYAIMGILQGLRVVFFSLEMTEKQVLERLYKRITGLGTKEGGDLLYPTFDCQRNQFGNCKSENRKSSEKLFASKESPKPKFKDAPEDYIPCDYCRTKNREQYQFATWFKVLNKDPWSHGVVADKIKVFQTYYKHLFKIKIFPKFSANMADIDHNLNILEATQGFTADMIILDHMDITKPEDSSLTGIQKEDETWMSAGRIAGERHALFVVGTQLTKEALDAYIVTHKHNARWAGKLGHVEAMHTLNQIPDEKQDGLMRIGTMIHRHMEFYEGETVKILQDIKTGQVNLGSFK